MACRNSKKDPFYHQDFFLFLPSCIAVDSFFRHDIASFLLSFLCRGIRLGKGLNKVLSNRTQEQDLRKDQEVLATGTVLTMTELTDDAPFAIELPQKMKIWGTEVIRGIEVTYQKDRYCLNGIAYTIYGNMGAA